MATTIEIEPYKATYAAVARAISGRRFGTSSTGVGSTLNSEKSVTRGFSCTRWS